MPTITHYAFEYFDPLRRRWVRARYMTSIEEIAQRYGPFRLLGKPLVREVSEDPLTLVAGHLARGGLPLR